MPQKLSTGFFSTAAREFLPLRELGLEPKNIIEIPETKLRIRSLFEDNKVAEDFAKVIKNRLRTKYIAAKYHHFKGHVKFGSLGKEG